MKTHKILVLHGPNLNLLGERQPEIYGHETLQDINDRLRDKAEARQWALTCQQSNHEGEIIDAIHAARKDGTDLIVINPAAYSHTSVAILDALNTFEGHVVEVHLSNIHQREAFRHHSYVSARADAVIAGMGSLGYLQAIDILGNS